MQEEEKKPTPFREGFRAVWNQARVFKRELSILSVLGFISAAANGSIPFISGKFFDSLIALSTGSEPLVFGVVVWGLLLGVWALVQLVANSVDWGMDRLRRDVEAKTTFNIQAKGFQHLLRLPVLYHKNAHINGVLQKLSTASYRVSGMIRIFVNVGPQLLGVCIGLFLALSISVFLGLVLMCGVVVYVLLIAWMVMPMAKVDSQAHKFWNDEWDDAAQAVHQVESVKNAAAEEYETEKIRRGFFERVYTLWMKLERYWSNVNFFQRIIVFATQLVVFLFSIALVRDGSLTVGELMALNGYAGMLFGPFVQLGHSWQMLQNGLTTATHAQHIFDEKPEIYTPPQAIRPPRVRGDVTFDHVSFRYAPDQPYVLSDIDFTVEAGEVIALVGESGVGKSTTIALLSGYTFPTEGEVAIDGIRTDQYELLALRKHIAIVPQEVALFNTSIKENIRYGTFDAKESEVKKVAEEVHLAEFIETMPKKYDTIVGERGVKLSVGQKQRVAIARAMLRNPSILILDEPTSALDAKTEQFVTESLERLMKGRTTFIIAHRLSTVRKANKILVFEKGKIVEVGTHQELIARPGGVYQRLYEYQIGLHE